MGGCAPATKEHPPETGFSESGATITANKGMRRAGGQAENERDHVPGDGAEKAGEEDVLVDQIDADHTPADGFGDGSAKNEGGDEVPKGGPEDGAKGSEHARGNDRGDGVRGDRKSVV